MKKTIVVLVALGVCTSGCGNKEDSGSKGAKPGAGDEATAAEAEKTATASDGGAAPGKSADEPQAVEKKPPSKAYRQALRKGRAQAKKGDWAGAVAAYEAALAESPDEPWALSELGLALYETGDLPRAREVTRAAIAAGTTPKVKAASLYNLGLVHEKLGENGAAADAYARSLTLRDHPVVVEALARVGGDAPPKKDLGVEPLQGPLKSLKDACSVIGGGGGCRVVTEGDADDPEAPYETVTTYRLLGRDDDMLDQFGCGLAVRTDQGWFVSDTAVFDELCDVAADFSITKMAFVDVDGGPPVIELRSKTWMSSRYADYGEDKMVVCGMGRSRVPSCTVPILVSGSYTDLYGDVESEDGEWEEVESKLQYEVSVDGAGNAIVIGDGHPLAGSHPMAFP